MNNWLLILLLLCCSNNHGNCERNECTCVKHNEHHHHHHEEPCGCIMPREEEHKCDCKEENNVFPIIGGMCECEK